MGEIDKEKLNELILKQLAYIKDQQVKYVYYILALSVSAIAYSISRTVEHQFNGLLIVWSLSLVCWSLSAFKGLSFLRIHIKSIDYDIGQLLSKRENNTHNPSLIDLQEQSRSEKFVLYNQQSALFFLGIVLFIVWHIIELYVASKCP